MKLNKILFAFTILLGCCLFPIIAKSAKAADTESFSVLIPKNIDMKNTDSTSFSIKAKGSLNDHDMITVTADSTVLMTRIGDDEYSGTAEVVLENAQWYGSDLNADTYAEKKGTITFFEDKAGSYTGQMLFSIEHKQSYNITYDPNGGTMPEEYPSYYYSEQGLDSLPVPTKENSKFIGWSETLDYTLGDYWEIGEDGSLLVSDLYAGANSGPQPKAPEKSGVKLLYRGITFSVENEAMLSFSFDYERKISTATSTEGGGKIYLYKDEELIDEFTPSGTTELIKGTIDYSKELDTGNYQIIYEGYVDIVGMKQGVTETVRNFSIVSLINSIPAGSTGDKDLIAMWDTAYSISYDPDGGMMPEEYPTYYYSNQGIDSLPVPVKDGNIFKGWGEITPYEVDPSSGWTESEDGFTHVGEKQLVINFELSDSATLSFDFINQSRMAPMEYPRYSIYKDGSVIIGQNLLSNDYLYEISHELEAGKYQLTVSSGIGNECTVSNILISSEIITSIPVGSTGEKNLTAIWEPAITYSISYNPNGGTMPEEYPTYYYSNQGIDSLPVPTKENYEFTGWKETVDYVLGDYWETDEEGNLLVSDKYAAANSGPQPRIADGLFPLYREITFSIDEQATLNFTFEYNKYYSSLYGMAEGGEFYLYKDDVLIDKFIPEDGTSGTKDYSTLLDSGNYQIIFVGYTTYLYYTNMVGVTQRVLDFSIARENITSIPAGSIGEKKLIAVWKANATYSISYNPAGGVMPTSFPDSYVIGEGIDMLPTPTKENSAFKGWIELKTNFYHPFLTDSEIVDDEMCSSVVCLPTYAFNSGSDSLNLNDVDLDLESHSMISMISGGNNLSEIFADYEDPLLQDVVKGYQIAYDGFILTPTSYDSSGIPYYQLRSLAIGEGSSYKILLYSCYYSIFYEGEIIEMDYNTREISFLDPLGMEGASDDENRIIMFLLTDQVQNEDLLPKNKYVTSVSTSETGNKYFMAIWD